jgi:hypothetical protein
MKMAIKEEEKSGCNLRRSERFVKPDGCDVIGI